MPPCIGKGLLTKLARHFLVVTVSEYLTSQHCFKCGGACGNHAYLAERDRRDAMDARAEKAFASRMARAATDAQKVAARRAFDFAMARPCEVRGLRFCSGCFRCLNRDGNSAPLMAVQLKRLLLGAGPLFKPSRLDTKIQDAENALDED